MIKYSPLDYNVLVSMILSAIDDNNPGKIPKIVESFIKSSAEPPFLTKEKIIQTLKHRESQEGINSLLIGDPSHIACLKIPAALLIISELEIEPTEKTLGNSERKPTSPKKSFATEYNLENVIKDKVTYDKIQKKTVAIGWCNDQGTWIERTRDKKMKACSFVVWLEEKQILNRILKDHIHLVANLLFNVGAGRDTGKNALGSFENNLFDTTFKSLVPQKQKVAQSFPFNNN